MSRILFLRLLRYCFSEAFVFSKISIYGYIPKKKKRIKHGYNNKKVAVSGMWELLLYLYQFSLT